MNTIFSITTILSAIFFAIEDCGGHCLGNENWTMFFIMLGIMMISFVLTILTIRKDNNYDKSRKNSKNTRRRN